MQKQLIDKRKSHAFRKDILLIGQDDHGTNYWLEYPSRDCNWYWGFGYVKTYTNNTNPSKSRGIYSHSHFSGLVGNQEKYDHTNGCFVKAEYISNVYTNPMFKSLVFDESTGWELSELFKRFYLLKDMAEYYHQGGCHLTTIGNRLGSKVSNEMVKNNRRWVELNTIEIPAVIEAILAILSPDNDVKFNIPRLTDEI